MEAEHQQQAENLLEVVKSGKSPSPPLLSQWSYNQKLWIIMRVENHTIKGEVLRCKQPKEQARWFTDGKKTTDIQQGF